MADDFHAVDLPSNFQVPPGFEPWTQNFTLIVPVVTGDESKWAVTTVNMADVNYWSVNTARLATSNGVGLGVSIMLLVVLVLLTKAEKRKSFIFYLNTASLFTNTIRCLLLAMYLSSTWNDPYSDVTPYSPPLTNVDWAIYVLINVFSLIVAILVYASLSLQVWIVCVTTPPLHRTIIMGATTTVACAAFGVKFAFVYLNTKYALDNVSPDSLAALDGMTYIMQTISIWLFSCVFTWKLGHAILQRRRLNMPRFGPMQIVFIMGCQTMSIPAIFTSLQFVESIPPEIVSHVLTIVCIFLPLSAMWAGVAHDQNAAPRGLRSTKNKLHGKPATSTLTDSSTACGNSSQMSSWSDTMNKDHMSSATAPTYRDHRTSVEDNCIRVDRKFGFSHEDAADRV
ncbi:uncharacterized protein J4E79_005863 [Alternaria viburni]|uniref:uncharacterized protein n=1 Tax=Alternaria viburni TaxID=566460 RepID=UPI0020C472A0|nr:uncharacterized protein J4E79_005863 [Alternaria viburni]KAI4660060.1 hypothetical protein J4E79_005863 [Alternaria viburni]